MAEAAAYAVKQMKLFPRSDDFAVLLGLRPSQIGTPPPGSEQHRCDVFNLLYIPRLHVEHPLQQDVVMSRFCALYLPQLVEKYLDPPDSSADPVWQKSIALEDTRLANAYGYMLVHLNGNPYFNRYFRLPEYFQKRRDLIMALLTRLDERTTAWEERLAGKKEKAGISIQSMVHDYCQLTTSLLLFESEEKVFEMSLLPPVKHLIPFLHWWNDRFANTAGKTTATNIDEKIDSGTKPTDAVKKQWPAYQLAMVLNNGHDKSETMAVRKVRLNKGGMSVCGMEGCNRSQAKDGLALFMCSQCGTCSQEHQTAAWKHPTIMHKEMCHRPVF